MPIFLYTRTIPVHDGRRLLYHNSHSSIMKCTRKKLIEKSETSHMSTSGGTISADEIISQEYLGTISLFRMCSFLRNKLDIDDLIEIPPDIRSIILHDDELITAVTLFIHQKAVDWISACPDPLEIIAYAHAANESISMEHHFTLCPWCREEFEEYVDYLCVSIDLR
jgi:hypothetical protein